MQRHLPGPNGKGDAGGTGYRVRATDDDASFDWSWRRPVMLTQLSIGSVTSTAPVRAATISIELPDRTWQTISQVPGAIGDGGATPYVLQELPGHHGSRSPGAGPDVGHRTSGLRQRHRPERGARLLFGPANDRVGRPVSLPGGRAVPPVALRNLAQAVVAGHQLVELHRTRRSEGYGGRYVLAYRNVPVSSISRVAGGKVGPGCGSATTSRLPRPLRHPEVHVTQPRARHRRRNTR